MAALSNYILRGFFVIQKSYDPKISGCINLQNRWKLVNAALMYTTTNFNLMLLFVSVTQV